jgi:hypothetical protein
MNTSKPVTKNIRINIATVKEEQPKNKEIIKENHKGYELASVIICHYPETASESRVHETSTPIFLFRISLSNLF